MQIRFTDFPTPEHDAVFIELEDDRGNSITGDWVDEELILCNKDS